MQLLQKFKIIIKSILNWDQRKFERICEQEIIKLDFDLNIEALRVLETVFVEQEYKMAFPFDKTAVVLDVGGHFGYFSMYARANLKRNSKIFTLEPSPSNLKVLKNNFLDNGLDLGNIYNCGLGKRTEKVDFYGGASYNHSIVPNDSAIEGKVQLYSLEDFIYEQKIDQVDFLKLDCEGAEYEIILNASSACLSRIKVISLEFHDREDEGFDAAQLVNHLEKNGFEILKFIFEHDSSNQGLKFGKIVGVYSI